MRVRDLRRFLLNKPDDLEITVQYCIVYKDKGISIDLRDDEIKGLWSTHCSDKECVLHFQPYLKRDESYDLNN